MEKRKESSNEILSSNLISKGLEDQMSKILLYKNLIGNYEIEVN